MRSDDDGVPRDGDGVAEKIFCLGVRRLEIGLLDPEAPLADEDVRRAGGDRRVVRLIAVDAGGGAAFEGSPDDHGVAGNGHRAEAVEDRRVRCFHIGDLAEIEQRSFFGMRKGGWVRGAL